MRKRWMAAWAAAVVVVEVALGTMGGAAWGAGPFLWVEAESATNKKVVSNAWFEAVDPNELSGGKWVASFAEGQQPTGTAEYALDIPEKGTYQLWIRLNPRGTGLMYKVDGGEFAAVDVKQMQKEDDANRRVKGYAAKLSPEMNVALDGNNDARALQWAHAGALELDAGKHTLTLNLGGDKGDKRFGAVDCFVLTTGAFAPNGKYKPGEQATDIRDFCPGRTWAFVPGKDEFKAEAVIDWRSLNEKEAGEHGFIKLSADGRGFVRGDGTPIRFWGGSDYVQRDAWRPRGGQMAELEHHARFLAKRGVNIVRLHGELADTKEGAKVTDVDADSLDQAFRLVAAMKKEGIYTIISPYWGSSTRAPKSWGLADSGNGSCTALVFFDPKLQEGYKAWVKALYTTKNPYTGIPLKDDPAVALIQFQNEDSMLFWTMQGVKGQQLKNLRGLYAEFLKGKYGSLEKAKDAWKGYKADDDDWEGGLPGMFIVWEFTRDAAKMKGGDAGREVRLADQLEFMAGTMHKFNAEIVRYLREELGCKQLTNAGNWRTVDQVCVDDAERWSYTATDVVGKNDYYSGIHRGINTGWQILPGQVYTDWSATLRPASLPMNVRQVADRPFIIPESLWVPPLLYQAEAPLMVAGQLSVTGVSTFYWFADGVEEWQQPLNIWTYATPLNLGQFPAAAYVFRKGLIKTAEPVVVEERSLAEVWGRKVPVIAEEGAFDPNRDTGDMPTESSIKTPVDPLVYLTGPVLVKFGGDPAKSRVADLSKLLDKDKKVVRSATGEITTDYGRGVYLVNAPQVQAAAGFLGKAGEQALADVTIACQNDYAAVTVVALDDQPIKDSAKVLVQVGTTCRPTGWQVRPTKVQTKASKDAKPEDVTDGFRIVATGSAPWQVEKAQGSVKVHNGGLTRAILLDPNLMPIGAAAALERTGDTVKVNLPAEAMYVVLESGGGR